MGKKNNNPVKKVQILLCKTGPDPIWMAWSGFGQTPLVQKQAGVQESSGPVLAEHKWPAAISHCQTQLRSSTASLDDTVQNQPRSSLVLADCVRFWPNRPSPETSRSARIKWPASGHCFWADPDQSESDPTCLLGKRSSSVMHTGCTLRHFFYTCKTASSCFQHLLAQQAFSSDNTQQTVVSQEPLA